MRQHAPGSQCHRDVERTVKSLPSLFNFRGRVGRLPFAGFMLVAWGLAYSSVFQAYVDASIRAIDPNYPSAGIPRAGEAPHLAIGTATAILVCTAFFAIALPWLSLSLLAKRFHDIGLSAWSIVPALSVLALSSAVFYTSYTLPLGAAVLLAILASIQGTSGPNRFDTKKCVASVDQQRPPDR